MPISLICGACEATLTAPDAAAGKRVKCRKCGAILEIPLPEPEPDADYEVVEEAPTMMMPSVPSARPKPAANAPPPAAAKALPPPAKAKPKPVKLEVDDDDDDRPAPKKKSKPVLLVDDDDDDRPTPKKPVRKLAAVDDDEEDDEDDEPRPKKGKKGKGKAKKAAGFNMPLVLGGATLGVALVGVLFWYFVLREPQYTGPIIPPQDSGVKGGQGPPPMPPGNPQGPPPGWQEFSKPEFTALFRSGGGQVREQAIPAQPGVRSAMAYANNTVNPGGAQVITVITLDAVGAAAARQDPNTFLDTMFNGSAAGGKGTITARAASQLDGKPARDATLQSSGKQMFLRAAVDGNRVYMLLAGGDGVNDSQNAQVKVFFDSFKPVAAGTGPGPKPNPGPVPPKGESRLVTTDLTPFGIPVTIDLPATRAISKSLDLPNRKEFDIFVEGLTKWEMKIVANNAISNKNRLEGLDRSFPGWKIIVGEGESFLWESPAANGNKVRYGAFMTVKYQDGTLWMHQEGAEMTREQADLVWKCMKSAKAK